MTQPSIGSTPRIVPSDLPVVWRAQASELRRVAAAECAARAYEDAAAQLERAARQADNTLLSVRDAAARVGRHRDTIGNAIRDGRLTNHGAKHRPRVRLGELLAVFPSKPVAGPREEPYDPEADARSLLETRRGGK